MNPGVACSKVSEAVAEVTWHYKMSEDTPESRGFWEMMLKTVAEGVGRKLHG